MRQVREFLKKCQKVREFQMSQGKVRETVIYKLKFNQLRIRILLNFSH